MGKGMYLLDASTALHTLSIVCFFPDLELGSVIDIIFSSGIIPSARTAD